MDPMMEILAPALLAVLFILFGLSHRGRANGGGCGACPNGCENKTNCKFTDQPPDQRL
jgi:hypothetical protein